MSSAHLFTTSKVFTATYGQAISTVLSVPAAAPSTTKAPSASILDAPHHSPTQFNPSDPIVLFCIQAGIIIILTRILALGLKKLKQPKVISEVLGGIILGPTAMGRIPNFTANIFPSQSLPYLSLVANIGLVLFLFLVGLEVDFSVFKRNARASLAVSSVGLVLPFGLGAAVSVGLYNKFVDADTVSFGHFLLFIAVAMSITAFPVLARILTELKLLQTDVGVCVLAAGVGNDVVGWILLALTIALVNAGSGVSAVYVLLCAVGWTLMLIYLFRPILIFVGRKTGSFENGPSNAFMVLLILLILTSAFVTDIIGVHPIFGGFLVGVIIPHYHGFTEKLTEKIEDLVSVLFLPIYFALSGLKTNLGLLNNGSIWGWVFCVIIVAFVSKFSGCALAARATGFSWRESAAVGSLMSCKGLVELIVLNIGLNAGILNNAVFAIFVLMALVTTFATTPLTLLFYPVWYRVQRAELKASSASTEAGSEKASHETKRSSELGMRTRFIFILNRLDNLPSMMAFTKLLHSPIEYKTQEKEQAFVATNHNITIDALRLYELTDRTSAVMKAADAEETAKTDPLSNIYSTFAGLNGFQVRPQLSIELPEDFPQTVSRTANENATDMVVIPWSSGANAQVYEDGPVVNPFEKYFKSQSEDRSPVYANFVRQIFLLTKCDVGLFLDRGVFSAPSAIPAGRQHIFLPFHGGPDDRAALEFTVQLCRHPGVSASIIRFVKTAGATGIDQGLGSSSDGPKSPAFQYTVHAGNNFGDTVYGAHSTENQLQSETADNLAFAKYRSEGTNDNAKIADALTRVTFMPDMRTALPLKETLTQASLVAPKNNAPLLIIVGRSRRAAPSHREELQQFLKEHVVNSGSGEAASLGIAASSDVRKSLGDCGSALVVANKAGSLLVIQAGTK